VVENAGNDPATSLISTRFQRIIFRHAFTFVPTDRLAASDKSTNVQTAIRVVIGWMSIMRHPPTGLGAIRASYSTIIGFKLTISRRKIKLSCLKLHPY